DKAEVAPAKDQLEFFEKKIRPVLVEQCEKCHSAVAQKAGQLKGGLFVDSRAGLLQGGDSGAAVVPSKPDDSLLLSALKYDGLQMPPKGRLPASVVADFETWIKAGAADPRTAVASIKRPTIDIETGRKFWAYQPPRATTPPAVADRAWPRTRTDLFLRAAQESKQIGPAEEATRAQLARRLGFDLLGLAPDPDDVDQFIADDEPDAVERRVDRLLASPRFGERWGRHWLDIVRFAESLTLRGFVMPEAWRYRDYVIETFNADRPIDEFIVEQMAGDLLTDSQLPAPSVAAADASAPARQPTSDDVDRQLNQRRRRLIATTFLTLGNTNLEEQDKKQLRMDVVDEQLDTIGKALLGQTLGCARCHDHKFDPIPTRDYYALAGILRSTKVMEHANVSKWLESPLPSPPDEEEMYRRHESQIAALQRRIKTLKDGLKVAASSGKSAPDPTRGPGPIAAKDLP
ncbi:MAG TPA: DUF1549 domain-containing protein, partial [Pirellulaceae bacterium]|nr:DUF1549 domain-containing protein [Pirellulaceae bacterium]